MPRPHVTVRPARHDDVPALVELWEELRDASGRTLPHGTPELVSARLARLVEDPASRAVVAELDGVVVGSAGFTLGTVNPLLDSAAVNISYLQVRNGERRHGVGRALLAAATAFADEVGADSVVVNVLPTLREANRFYARLGFAPLVVRRVAPVPALRRRLAADRRACAPDDSVGRRRRLQAVGMRAAVGRVASR